jgi:hypothetical protein
MSQLGDTAENLGAVLLSMRAGGFSIAVSEPSRQGLVFFGQLEKATRWY